MGCADRSIVLVGQVMSELLSNDSNVQVKFLAEGLEQG